MTFREIILNETVKEKKFNIDINNITYTIIRDPHLTQKRNGDSKPKDFKMTKNKYKDALEKALDSSLDLKKPFSISWSTNGKSNIISASLSNNIITIFGAIMNSSKKESELYKTFNNRLSIDSI